MKNRRPSPRKERGARSKGASSSAGGKEKERQQLYPDPAVVADSDPEDEEGGRGFGKWLRTGDGFQYLRFFVVLNSLAVFLTMGWPQISVSLQALYEFFIED